jgi:hypothetical protein
MNLYDKICALYARYRNAADQVDCRVAVTKSIYMRQVDERWTISSVGRQIADGLTGRGEEVGRKEGCWS